MIMSSAMSGALVVLKPILFVGAAVLLLKVAAFFVKAFRG